MIYLLDTDHITLIQRGPASEPAVFAHLSTLAPDDYGVSIVSYEEQTEGRLAEINRAKTMEGVVNSYALLLATLQFYSAISVWQ